MGAEDTCCSVCYAGFEVVSKFLHEGAGQEACLE